MLKTLIHITEEDIGLGTVHNCHSCPLALAISRALPPDPRGLYHVGLERIFFVPHQPCAGFQSRMICALPQEVTDWIDRFDSGALSLPAVFELEFFNLPTPEPQTQQ